MPAARSSSSSVLEHLGRGRVDVGHRLRGDHDPRTGGRRCGQPRTRAAEDVGVREEERRVEAVQEQPRDRARVRVAREVVVALEPSTRGRARRRAAARRAAGTRGRRGRWRCRCPTGRPRRTPSEAADREARTPPAAPRNRRSTAAMSISPITAEMTTAASAASAGPANEPGGEEQDEREAARADERRSAASSAPAASATGVRTSCSRAGSPGTARPPRSRRRARQLLVLVDLLAEAAGIASREDARVGEGDEGDADAEQQLAEVGGRDGGDVERRQPLGQTPTTSTPGRRGRASDVTSIAPTTATKTPGTTGANRFRTMITARHATPMRQRVTRSSRRGAGRRREPRPGTSSPPTEKPNSFGSWVMITVSAIPAR